MFSLAALKNISKTGNVWGHTIEYVYNFSFHLGSWNINVSQRRKGTFMGRFGGGWNFRLGLQGSSYKSWIFSYWVGSIRVSKQ